MNRHGLESLLLRGFGSERAPLRPAQERERSPRGRGREERERSPRGRGREEREGRENRGGHAGRDDRGRSERENRAGRDVRAPATPALPARAVVREDVALADDGGTWKTKRGKRAGRGGDVAAQAERYEERYGAAATRT